MSESKRYSPGINGYNNYNSESGGLDYSGSDANLCNLEPVAFSVVKASENSRSGPGKIYFTKTITNLGK